MKKILQNLTITLIVLKNILFLKIEDFSLNVLVVGQMGLEKLTFKINVRCSDSL